MDYSFNSDIAIKYGVDCAVIIHNLYWWICKNIANEKHIYNGKAWTYNTIKAFSDLFPFFTERQIRNNINKLKGIGAIEIENFNKTKLDRTQWYALNNEILEIYQNVKCKRPKCQMGESAENSEIEKLSFSGNLMAKIAEIDAKITAFALLKGENSTENENIEECAGFWEKSGENGQKTTQNDGVFDGSIVKFSHNMAEIVPNIPKCQMHVPEMSNACAQNVKCKRPKCQMHLPILSNGTDINTNIKLISKSINQSKLNNIINLNTYITPLSPKLGELTDRLTSKTLNITQKAPNITDNTPIIPEKVKWYVNWLNDKINQSSEVLGAASIGSRLTAIVEEISHRQTITINGYPVAAEIILESYVNFFRDDELSALIAAYEVIDDKVAAGTVKNKLNYTISTLYNAARL